jgi:hypothetical protein
MEITLTTAQYAEMETLASLMAMARVQRASSTGELHIDETKIEWDSNEVKFTLTDAE